MDGIFPLAAQVLTLEHSSLEIGLRNIANGQPAPAAGLAVALSLPSSLTIDSSR